MGSFNNLFSNDKIESSSKRSPIYPEFDFTFISFDGNYRIDFSETMVDLRYLMQGDEQVKTLNDYKHLIFDL